MFAKVLSSAVLGIDAYTLQVLAHLENTTSAVFFTVGLPESAEHITPVHLSEAKEYRSLDRTGWVV